MKLPILFLSLALFVASSFSSAEDAKPKYGPTTVPISQDHSYIRKSAAPDYWAISPFYASQRDERSCSLASVTMLVNAVRKARAVQLGSEDKLATQDEVLKKADDQNWTDVLTTNTHGTFKGLEALSTYIEKSLKAYGVPPKKVEFIRAEDLSKKTADAVHKALVENEKSDQDFLIASFDQFEFTQDTHVGHVAPVGAYDAAKKRVLIFDPDRQWYEPYWVPEDVFLKGLSTLDPAANKKRGLVWIKY